MAKEISLFLGYTNGDFTDKELRLPPATSVMAALEKLNERRVNQITGLGLNLGISLVSLPGKEVCPAEPAARNFLQDKIKLALSFAPQVIWFDHLRFEGHWEAVAESLTGLHPTCPYCQNKKREEIISGLAGFIRANVPKTTKIGYFAVPLKEDDFEGVMAVIGQDHAELGNIFDFVSPMVYHRMISKPVSYIREYVEYLADLGISAKILPIVQVKDMPDALPDALSIDEIAEEIKGAVEAPSAGVAIFCWDHAIEKNKIKKVSAVLKALHK